MPYPVAFDVERPETFERSHVFLRLALLIVIGWVSHPMGLLWLGLPVVAAVLLAQKGGERYLDEDGPMMTGILSWIVGFAAYLALLTDRLPGAGQPVRLEVERSGSPTTGSALLRIVAAIPSVIVLSILVFFASIVWWVAVICILVSGSYPESLWHFLRGIVRWEACLVAYLASLVDRYPPFALETSAPVTHAARSS